MNKSFSKVIALLAAAGISPREVDEFLSVARHVGFSEIARSINNYKRLIALERQVDMLDLGNSEEFGLSRPEKRVVYGLEASVERLLLDEAGLSKSAAMSAMTKEVLSRHPKADIPTDSKKGFAAWVNKLSEIIPDSEVLYLATKIRNSYVHDVPSDWRL